MKKTILTVTVFASIVLSAVFFTTSGCGPDGQDGSDTMPKDSSVETGISNKFSIAPADMLAFNQASADTFSWLSFIAMNWPANPATCQADTTKSILSGSGPTVWESYLSPDQVFVAPGSQPAVWCANSNSTTAMAHLPAGVQELARQTGVNRFIHMDAKAPSIHGIDEASGGPLVDQHGRFVRYEIRMNLDEYSYLIGDTLWNKTGQTKYAQGKTQFDFPAGPTSFGTQGAMEIKAAWKVLGPGDDTASFYTMMAIVYNNATGQVSPGNNPVMLGLVGLHIARKTASQVNWIWSTFEHKDNLTKSFYNPACDTCTPNRPIAGSNIVELDSNGVPLHPPTQVKRLNPVNDPFAGPISTYYHDMLQGSVWANYDLISTQWTQFEDPAPAYLANSVLETYLQGPVPASYGKYTIKNGELYYKNALYRPFSPESSSSCMGCHYTGKSAGIRSDFSFILNNAK